MNGPRANQASLRPLQTKLIFNPSAGAAAQSPAQLMDVIREMQAWKLVPEACLVEPDSDLPQMVRDALAQGIRMFVVCGGDGTISAVARTLAATHSGRATLGIIPIGTRNNTALSLGIPSDIPAAVAILRAGRRIKVDLGVVGCHRSSSESGPDSTPFLEVCSVGLVSSLFPAADDIQHGNLARIPDLLATFLSAPPAEMHLILDGKREIHGWGHVVLVSNMPIVGPNYRISEGNAFADGWLDVVFFADLSRLDLLGYVLKGVRARGPQDPRVQHYQVRSVEIDTHPALLVNADGNALGEGPVRIAVRRRALAVMVGWPGQEASPDQDTAAE